MGEYGLSNDLNRINNLVFQWKMSFNPDSSKQAHKIIFSSIIKKLEQPPLIFNNNIVTLQLLRRHFPANTLRKPKLTLR